MLLPWWRCVEFNGCVGKAATDLFHVYKDRAVKGNNINAS